MSAPGEIPFLIFSISREKKSTKTNKKENRSHWNGFHERLLAARESYRLRAALFTKVC